MRKMKDSGVEWIGEIPEDWEITTYRRLLNRRKEYDDQDKQVLSLTIQGVKVKNENYGKMAEDFTGHQIVKQGDLVFTPRDFDATPILSGIAPCDGCISNLYFVLYPHNISETFIPFINYFMWGVKWGGDIWKRLSYGMRFSYNFQQFGALPIAVPPIDTQRRIADFLDDKCGKIDRYIEKQQKIIDKLKEYKQVVITEAVTKGLNPDVPMKDSGIEWIGMIPEHWGVAKLANLFTFLGGYAFNSDLYVSETENLIVRIGNVKNDRLLFDANPVYISDDLAEQVIKFKLQCGDILFTMTGTKGKRDYFYTLILDNFHIQTKNLYLNQRVGCFRKKAHIHAEYYNYLLKDNRILDSIFLYETGTANQGNLGIDSINRTKVHLPPYDEQIMIANYLKEKCSRIDAVIAKKEVAINKSTEYKKSLIYEAVTGKLEV